MIRLSQSLSLLFLCFLLFSCALQTDKHPESAISFPKNTLLNGETPSFNYWWYARFKFVMPDDEQIFSFSDNLFIAHQVIMPVLRKQSDNIRLWRFHRRAANDTAGHQFSFIFYSSQDTAQKIFKLIESNPLPERLIKENILQNVFLDNVMKPRRPEIEDTSDKNWTLAIQKSWPYYIMGVSTLWLDLLNQELQEIQIKTVELSKLSIKEQQDQYARINAELTRQWKEQGKHAYFHHINAIFGYEPLEIRF
ncbi:MAG: hypothetical protein GY694_14200 [Gammaproteobacteria bacterium]|nr:hypothetical protein [Gammaproteobacteria bacterium]